MTHQQITILAILAGTLVMFLWGRWRHDMVAVGALLACVATGLVPGGEAFLGFGHPAVVTVACILVLSGTLQTSGAVDVLARVALPKERGPVVTTAALQLAEPQKVPPGRVLMPLAFGSILGGMTTLIGTPPNLIVSGFRAAEVGQGFTMFAFTPVGAAVAAVGVVFVVVFDRWLVPERTGAGAEGFETGAYLTEAHVTKDAKAAGLSLAAINKALEEADAQVIGLIRDERRIPAPSPHREVRAGDILVIEAEPESLASALSSLGLTLEEAVPEPDKEKAPVAGNREAIQSGDVVLAELAVLPGAALSGRSATDIRLRDRFGINLLAVSRQGHRSTSRLRVTPLAAGDVLLMQGTAEALGAFGSQFGCVPLAQRDLRIPDKRQAIMASGVLVASVAAAAFGLVTASVAFAGGVLAAMALRLVSPRRVYELVDWPVVVLLGALIPVAGAMATTGAADLLARLLLDGLAQGHPVVALVLVLVLVVTMTLSDFMNNAATAAVMCPVAIQAAERLGSSADPFLMAVAVGASCAFLTPIGHQNNTLILGPGGFRFGDFWRLGLPLELVVIATAVPMILLVWPL